MANQSVVSRQPRRDHDFSSGLEAEEESKTWHWAAARSPVQGKLPEFTVSDLDGNLFRVFYDFRGDPE